MSDGENDRDERAALIESRMNMERAAGIEVSPLVGLGAKDFAQVFEFAKGMSMAGPMVPAFCRNRPWTCVGIILQSLEWRMSPFSVARQAYEVENKRTGERTVAYMSQLLHAVLEARAPLKERLRVRYEGEGDDRICIVSGIFKGENEPREWRSPRLGDRRPQPQKRRGRDGEEYEATSGSPLWYSKPDVQLFHDTSRDFARIYCPDIVMGIYAQDEMDEHGFVDVTPVPTPSDDGGLARRLSESALARAGFSAEHALAAVDEGRRRADNGAGRGAGASATSAPGSGGEAGSAREASPPPPEAEQGAPSSLEEAAAAERTADAVMGRRRRRRTPQPDDDGQPGLM